MKKVLSVAMASAMVLGMGANAFAIKYNVDSNDTAKWPTNFGFEGKLFVTDKNGDLVTGATTNLNRKNAVDFQPGDVVWMPLYADNQVVYDSAIKDEVVEEPGINNIRLTGTTITVSEKSSGSYKYANGAYVDANGTVNNTIPGVWYPAEGKDIKELQKYVQVTVSTGLPADGKFKYDNKTVTAVANSERYFIGANEYDYNTFCTKLAENKALVSSAYITVNAKGVAGSDAVIGDAFANNQNGTRVPHGLYTGNIDKNWSVNLLEDGQKSTITNFVEKAELYKADEIDYHSYKNNNVDIMPNAVYVRVHLKDSWKTCDVANVKYYVYVANNAGKQTNKVYVEGKYAAAEAKKVDFTWSNDASVASLWKAEENGTAVFDFQDKAFFTVKMYKGECLYLDLDAAYKLATAKDFDGEIDSFYYFDNENSNFFREGELVIVSDNDALNVYNMTEDGAEYVEAEYVKGHAVAHTNQKVNGYVFNTKELGNYVLAEDLEDDEIIEDEDDANVEIEDTDDAEEVEAPAKVNPDTGANDFVGLAVSLAVVSVAAAGALALKK